VRVGYLGPPGTYSHEALVGLPDAPGWEATPLATVHAAVLAVQDRSLDRALVPIENSLEGSVNATLDAITLEADDVDIVGELVHPVHHCLIAGGPLALDAIRAVRSHPQALAQCAAFLRDTLPQAEVLPAQSTSEAVRSLAGAPDVAAIGSRAAADLYGATVLRGGVEDVTGNQTRFAWLAPSGTEPVVLRGGLPTAWRTSLVWSGEGSTSPGWLVRCLSEFAFRGVNLTRIESRPRREPGFGEYLFFVDLDGRAGEPRLREAIERLGAEAGLVRVLGSFPTDPAAGRDAPGRGFRGSTL
jgi:prephenate dehydratase